MSNVGRRIYGNCDGYFKDDDCDKVIVKEDLRCIVVAYVDCDKERKSVYFSAEDVKQDCIDRWAVVC